MKKSKLSFGLAFTLLPLVAVSACSPTVTPNDKNIVSFTDPNGNTVNIPTDEIYANYKVDKDGVERFYNALVEVVVRNEMNKEEYADTKAHCESLARNRVEGSKEQAQSNAEANGTSYDEEFESILDSNNCEDEEELFDLYTYQEMTSALEDEWFSTEELSKELVKTDGYFDTEVPYHVRHILVNVTASIPEGLSISTSPFTSQEITSSEAAKLSYVVSALASGNESFGTIAYRYSDDSSGDTSSRNNYGDVGIMGRSTSFVNEFKLGIYTYDLLYQNVATRSQTLETALGLDKMYPNDEIAKEFKKIGLDDIGTIPYGAILKLGQVANVETSNSGAPVNNGVSLYYPRNILFNKYFNKHNVSIITPNDVTISDVDASGRLTSSEDFTGTLNMDYVSKEDKSKERFQQIAALDNQYALCDEQGNVILVVRAGSGYEGVHFMVVQRNYLDEVVNGVTLQEYYTTAIPGEELYPTTGEGEDRQDKATYVNFIRGNNTTYNTRASQVREAIMSYNPYITDDMYEKLFVEQKVVIHDKTLATKIDEYLETRKLDETFNRDETFEDSWDAYIDLLKIQQQLRAVKNINEPEDGEEVTDKPVIYEPVRLISETCAVKFQEDPNSPAFAEGGICYYAQ